MKIFFKYTLYFIIFVVSFMAFFPKDKLFYYIQKRLSSYKVSIVAKDLRSYPFSFDIKENYILFSGIKIVTIKDIKVSVFGIKANDIKGVKNYNTIIPHINNINIYYKFGNFAYISGNFGTIVAKLNISKKEIILNATLKNGIIKKYSMFFGRFKKVGKQYVYKISL